MHEVTEETAKKQVKIYITVFVALAILTVVTVAISYLRLPVKLAIIAALLVAVFKSSLVAAFFMHLTTEKKIILSILVLTIFFFLMLLLLPAATSAFHAGP
jgi:cytochrome c oxidase subunit IV